MQAQVDWYARRLKVEWRVRGPGVLVDPAHVVPRLLDFQALVDLSDRDLRLVLEHPRVLALGPEKLGKALSAPGCPIRPRVLRNVSDARRAAIEPHINESESTEKVCTEQQLLSLHVYFAILEGQIDPPPVVQAQIDAKLELVDEELRQWARGVLHDGTFGRVLTALTAHERTLAQNLVGRQVLLWALLEAPDEILAFFVDEIAAEGGVRLRADIAHAGGQAETQDERLWRVAEARLKMVEAARLLVALRTWLSRGRR